MDSCQRANPSGKWTGAQSISRRGTSLEDVLMASLNKRSGIDLSRKLTSPLFLAMIKMS
jgi:hypothetical protein